jgi:hypothetical protein
VFGALATGKYFFASYDRAQFEAVFQSTLPPIAQEVTHRELYALVAQDAIDGGYMIEEVGDRECD